MNAKKLFFTATAIMTAPAAFAATVSRIDVSGNQRMDAESIRILSDVKVGDNVSAEGANQVAKRLQESGYFSRVSVRMSGNVLKIDIAEAPTVNMVTIEGNDEISTDDLKKELRLKSRDPYDESVIGADVQRMLTIYQRKGFFGTKIEPQKIELDDNRVNVVYEIDEGHPTYIRNIEFEGNKVFRDSELRDQILSREHAWWRFMTQFDVFDEDRILYDQQMIRQFYMRNGYVDIQVTDANGVFTPDRQYYSVTFTVDEGEKYKFGKLTIKNPFPDVPDSELYDVIAMDDGDVYNIDLVDETISNLRGAVADHGYAFINVNPVPKKNDDTKTIDLEFDIEKTNRIYLNNINILGNVRTFDSVIEQLIPMRSGDPFSLQTIEEGRQNLMRTRYFKDVKMVPNRIADANMINLDIQVEEQPTGELSGGFGWSNINGFMVDAGITETNFMGRGQVVIEFRRTQVSGEQLPVKFDGRVVIRIDIGRIGLVPQRLRSGLLPCGDRRRGSRRIRRLHHFGGHLTRRGRRLPGIGGSQASEQNHNKQQALHGINVLLPTRSGRSGPRLRNRCRSSAPKPRANTAPRRTGR